MNEYSATEIAYHNGFKDGKNHAVRHAYWKDDCDGYKDCSYCGYEHPILDHRGYSVEDRFCPHCGSMMDLKV